jgi:hypothetical protein
MDSTTLSTKNNIPAENTTVKIRLFKVKKKGKSATPCVTVILILISGCFAIPGAVLTIIGFSQQKNRSLTAPGIVLLLLGLISVLGALLFCLTNREASAEKKPLMAEGIEPQYEGQRYTLTM